MSEDVTTVFEYSFGKLQWQAYNQACKNGFWPCLGSHEADQYQLAGKVALIHSEASELLEAIRNGNPQSEKIPEFSQAEEELADIVIRVMDLTVNQGWRVAEAVVAKMNYNATREYKHGKTL